MKNQTGKCLETLENSLNFISQSIRYLHTVSNCSSILHLLFCWKCPSHRLSHGKPVKHHLPPLKALTSRASCLHYFNNTETYIMYLVGGGNALHSRKRYCVVVKNQGSGYMRWRHLARWKSSRFFWNVGTFIPDSTTSHPGDGNLHGPTSS